MLAVTGCPQDVVPQTSTPTHPGVAVPVLGAALCVLRAPAHVVDVLGPVGEGGAAAVAGAWRHEAV